MNYEIPTKVPRNAIGFSWTSQVEPHHCVADVMHLLERWPGATPQRGPGPFAVFVVR